VLRSMTGPVPRSMTSATVQAADAINNIPAVAKADRGKARTRNPPPDRSSRGAPFNAAKAPRATRRAHPDPELMAILPAGGTERRAPNPHREVFVLVGVTSTSLARQPATSENEGDKSSL
jgi:hypothetical protein